VAAGCSFTFVVASRGNVCDCIAFLLKCMSSSVLFLVRSVSTSVLSTDLDIHFGSLSLRPFASSVLIQRTEVDKDRSGRGPKWL